MVTLRVDPCAVSLFRRGLAGNLFCGVCNAKTGIIYLGPLAPQGRGTSYPDGIPLEIRQGVYLDGNRPIVHTPSGSTTGTGLASHEQLSSALKLQDAKWVGFTVQKFADHSAELYSLTSRSLNRFVFSFTQSRFGGQGQSLMATHAPRTPGLPRDVSARTVGSNEHGQQSAGWGMAIARALQEQFPSRPKDSRFNEV